MLCGHKKITNSFFFGVSSKCKCNDWATRLVCTSDCVSTASGRPRPEPGTVVTVTTTFRLIEHVSLCALRQHRVVLHMTSIISWWSRCGATSGSNRSTPTRLSLSREQFACNLLTSVDQSLSAGDAKCQGTSFHQPCAMRHTPSSSSCHLPSSYFFAISRSGSVLLLLRLGTMWSCDRRWRWRNVECVFTR